jgi:hypothetical protein
MATTAQSTSTAMLSSTESACTIVASGSTTRVTAKAPIEMKTPWPKFSTSMRPKTSVKPEAMMKIIMPMARPATVSVSQPEKLPISGSATITNTGTSRIGTQSRRTCGGAAVADALAAGIAVIGARPD